MLIMYCSLSFSFTLIPMSLDLPPNEVMNRGMESERNYRCNYNVEEIENEE